VHERDELVGDIKLEEQLSKNTAQYNKLLTEEPSNVEIWLKYVQFQVFFSIICYINLVYTSHTLSGMYFVMYSFTTHNSSIYIQLFNIYFTGRDPFGSHTLWQIHSLLLEPTNALLHFTTY
jgi:hypothetical protein